SRQLETLAIRRLTPRCQQEDARTNGRRGVPGILGRLWVGASRNPNSRVQPQSVPGGPIGVKRGPTRGAEAAGGGGDGAYRAAGRGGVLRKISPSPSATGGSLPPPGPPLASLCSRQQKRQASGGFSPKSAVDSPVAS